MAPDRPLLPRRNGVGARHLREMNKTVRQPHGVRAERDRAAQRPGRRDRAGAPLGAEPSERSERPALEGKQKSLSARRLRETNNAR